ncbi:MAG: hypothetical protein OQL28_14850 [Sedimenticola sp.]|nr:hypothetical protein [Sedimenticola sp.]
MVKATSGPVQAGYRKPEVIVMFVYCYRKQTLAALLLLLCSAASTSTLAATTAMPWQQERSLHAATGGLLYSLPQIDRQRLGDEINRLNQTLKARQRQLAGELEKSRLTAGDAVLAAVLPGGLIYAALKHQRSARTEAELLQVAAQLEDLQEIPLRSVSDTPLLAAR